MRNETTPLAILTLAGVMFVTTIAGMVTLVVTGHEGAALERVAGPLLTAMIVTGVLGASAKSQQGRLDDQDAKLDRITHQTNGVLDGRIKNGAKAALRELAEEERQGRL